MRCREGRLATADSTDEALGSHDAFSQGHIGSKEVAAEAPDSGGGSLGIVARSESPFTEAMNIEEMARKLFE